MKIYLAHTYGRRQGLSEAEIGLNVNKSIEIARILILKGHNPYIPNLLHHVHKGWKDSPQEEKWVELDLERVEDNKALLVGHMSSPDGNVAREIKTAQKLGMKIYWSIDEVP